MAESQIKIYLAKEVNAFNLVDPKEVGNTNSLRITYRNKDETGSPVKGFSGDLEFSGEAQKLFQTEIIDNPNGELKVIYIRIVDGCCDDFLLFEGEIRGRDITWCEYKCVVNVSPVQTNKALDCLNSILIYESSKATINGGAATGFINRTDFPHPVYCVETRPQFYADLFISVGIITAFSLATLETLVYLIQAIKNSFCFVATSLGFDCDIDNAIVEGFDDLRAASSQGLIDCGLTHPTPRVRDYIQNACDMCGLKFTSSIFNDVASPYYETLYLYAPFNGGYHNKLLYDEDTYAFASPFTENYPVKTAQQFITEISNGFNCDNVVVNGNELIIERHDYFEKQKVWIDFTKMDTKRINRQCYSFTKDDLAAFAIATLSADAIDNVGNEAHDYYDAIVEWNVPFNALQKGHKDIALQFGYSRYRGDNITVDIFGRTIYNFFFIPFQDKLDRSENGLLLEHGKATVPKLIIWDGQDLRNSKIVRYQAIDEATNGGFVPGNGFNFPMIFRVIDGETPAQYSGGKLQMTVQKNMLYNFWAIENPKLMAFKRRDYTIEFQYLCEDLKSFDINNIVKMFYSGTSKEGTMDVSVDFQVSTRVCTINGKV